MSIEILGFILSASTVSIVSLNYISYKNEKKSNFLPKVNHNAFSLNVSYERVSEVNHKIEFLKDTSADIFRQSDLANRIYDLNYTMEKISKESYFVRKSSIPLLEEKISDISKDIDSLMVDYCPSFSTEFKLVTSFPILSERVNNFPKKSYELDILMMQHDELCKYIKKHKLNKNDDFFVVLNRTGFLNSKIDELKKAPIYRPIFEKEVEECVKFNISTLERIIKDSDQFIHFARKIDRI